MEQRRKTQGAKNKVLTQRFTMFIFYFFYYNLICPSHALLLLSAGTWQESSCGFGCRTPLAAFSLKKQSNSLPLESLEFCLIYILLSLSGVLFHLRSLIRVTCCRSHYNSVILRRAFEGWRDEWWSSMREWSLTTRAECHYKLAMQPATVYLVKSSLCVH